MLTILPNIMIKLRFVDLIVTNLTNYSPLVILGLRTLSNSSSFLFLLAIKMCNTSNVTLAHGTLVLRLHPLIDAFKTVNMLARV